MTPKRVLAGRLLALVTERCTGRGYCRLDWADMIWTLAERYPHEPRPRLYQISDALIVLRQDCRIQTRLDYTGRWTCYLVSDSDERDREQPMPLATTSVS